MLTCPPDPCEQARLPLLSPIDPETLLPLVPLTKSSRLSTIPLLLMVRHHLPCIFGRWCESWLDRPRREERFLEVSCVESLLIYTSASSTFASHGCRGGLPIRVWRESRIHLYRFGDEGQRRLHESHALGAGDQHGSLPCRQRESFQYTSSSLTSLGRLVWHLVSLKQFSQTEPIPGCVSRRRSYFGIMREYMSRLLH